VVTGSLKDFCNRSFHDSTTEKETSLLAVTDVRANREIKRLNKGGANLTSYFNTGVFYSNLKKWRAENMAEKMIEIGRKYGEQLVYLDQDIMNIFFKGDQGELEDTYNKDAAVKYTKLPIILHYLGNSKPWHYVDNSSNKHIYRKYLKMTPFKNLKPEGISLENFARKYVRLFRQKRSSGPDYTI
jgi:lipopolysaccharide biosynthesis glycosyltransferase